MTSGKSYNSIVFLTTLYLGLVFVGATPQILTFAALTRNFDVQNEIEVKDDLDNKPENEEVKNLANDDFVALFTQFLIELKSKVGSGNISLPLQIDFQVNSKLTKSPNGGGGGGGSNVFDQNLSTLIQNAIEQKFEPQAFELADFDDGKSKSVKITIESTNTDLSVKTSFTKVDADKFAAFLNEKFSLTAFSVKNSFNKQLYTNTRATSENNQVIIVTRLPRGSLDALLANKDAQ